MVMIKFIQIYSYQVVLIILYIYIHHIPKIAALYHMNIPINIPFDQQKCTRFYSSQHVTAMVSRPGSCANRNRPALKCSEPAGLQTCFC
jgi:hypothetical protein